MSAFASPVAKPKAKAAAPSKNTSPLHRDAPFGHRLDDGGAEYLRMLQRSIGNQPVLRLLRRQGLIENKHGDAGQDIGVYSPTSRTQTRPFTARLRAIVKGSQSDALSADRPTSPAESEPQIRQSDVPKPEGSKLQRKDSESFSIPDGWLPSVSGEQTDSITSHLNYVSSIKNEGPPPTDFGITRYIFTGENVRVDYHPAVPGTPAGSGSAGTPPTPAYYDVNADIRGAITFQVDNFGRTDIASDSDPAITQRNYPNVVADLTPPPAPVVHNRRQFMKNQPFRDHFWARDLTIRHERFHCDEDDRFGAQGVQAAQAWLNTQTANSDQQLLNLLRNVITIIGRTVTAGRAVPADEQRAYDNGAPLYLARVQAIKRKGDANGYAPRPAPAPKPPAPAPKPPAPAPQRRGPAPTPAGVTSGAAAGSRFGHSFGDVAVSGEQPISETSARNETALPTSQTDAGPPTPTHRVPSLPAPPLAGPAAPQCTISSQTLDTAPDGTAGTRTVVGVNEIVMMTASTPSTWSATAGTIIATGASASSAWVSPASAKPVSCSVTATPPTGSPCSINFLVIPPRERKMTKTTDHAYTAGRAGSGFEATALILPLNVSFSGIKVREETIDGEATGYYKNVLGWDKGKHPRGKWNRVDAKNNNVKDTIGTKPPGTRGPFGIGTFFWPIPLTWRTPNDPKTFPYGTADQIQVMTDSRGSEITSKEGADRARTP
jgi:hypothetical protein